MCEPSIDWASFTAILKDWVNIFFFIVTGAVAIATCCLAFRTYKQASRSIFMPLRTELFKLQVKAYEQVLELFHVPKATSLERHYGLDTVTVVNVASLVNDLHRLHFKDKISRNEWESHWTRDEKKCPVFYDILREVLKSPDKYPTQAKRAAELSDDPDVADSSLYCYSKIRVTTEIKNQFERLAQVASSPLLPNDLRDKLDKFVDLYFSCVHKIGFNISIAKEKFEGEYKDKLPTCLREATLSLSRKIRTELYKADFEAAHKEVLDTVNLRLNIEELLPSMHDKPSSTGLKSAIIQLLKEVTEKIKRS